MIREAVIKTLNKADLNDGMLFPIRQTEMRECDHNESDEWFLYLIGLSNPYNTVSYLTRGSLWCSLLRVWHLI